MSQASQGPGPLRVLIVEDEEPVAVTIKYAFEALGHRVVGLAYDGEEGIEAARALGPDLISTDIRLPRGDGIEVARAINAETPTPMIILSAYADQDLVHRASEAGVFAYLVKPFTQAGLRAAVAVALARFEEFRELRDEVRDLRLALDARKLVERAKGRIMQRLGVNEPEAFRALQEASRGSRRRLVEVAQEVIDAPVGALPAWVAPPGS